MNDFKGLSRDTGLAKTPEQMWHLARNIILSRQYLSLSNEQGSEFLYNIPGTFLGAIATNEDIVYFSKEGDYSCIGYCNNKDNIYIPVLRTNNPNFQFKYDCPIEGIYIYNYKKELIICFSDNINPNSSTPKVINLHNTQIALDSNKEFINPDDYLVFEMFTYNKLPIVNFEYTTGGLTVEVIHLAICYVYDDNTDGLFTPILETVYPNFKHKNTDKYNVKFNLSGLSNTFKKAKLAFIAKGDKEVDGYISPILPIKPDGTLSFTLSSFEDLINISPEEILIQPERFTKVKSITKTGNQPILANVETKENFNFQKYANMLNLKYGKDTLFTNAIELYKQRSHPTFLPDEVYAFFIVPVFKDGSEGHAFHIPGRAHLEVGGVSERDPLDLHDIQNYKLSSYYFLGNSYKTFHLYNNGGTTPNLWGYWENEETYPNEDYYNSSDLGGEDLRGKPVRLHRFPEPSVEVIPRLREYNVDDPQRTYNNPGFTERFYIYIDNFNTVVPQHIRDLLQGYKIVFEKRKRGNSYVEQPGLSYLFGIYQTTDVSVPEGVENDVLFTVNNTVDDFSNHYFISPETLKDSPSITSKFIKIYNIIQGNNQTLNNRKYAHITHTNYDTPLNAGSPKTDHRLFIQATSYENPTNYTDTKVPYVPISSGTMICILHSALVTVHKNLYNIHNNTDFITSGYVPLSEPNKKLYNGDMFLSTIIRQAFSYYNYAHLVHDHYVRIFNYLSYYIHNMYSSLSNHYIENTNATTKLSAFSDSYKNWVAGDVNSLNSFDYSLTVKNKDAYYFNDETHLVYPLTINYINYFPYRVYKGLNIPNESLQTRNLRFIPSNQYYDMRNDRGEIIAVRGFNNGLYIQQQHSLFMTTVSDKLNSDLSQVYLGNTELFDRVPQEILYNGDIGYIGSNSQFACTVYRDGYLTVNEEQGKVFLVQGDRADELNKKYVKNSFEDNLPLGFFYNKDNIIGTKDKVDNPYLSVGYIIGFEDKYNRLLLTKKYYEPTQAATQDLIFDGEFYTDNNNEIVDFNNAVYFENHSKTFSYALDSQTWVCEHDYFPSAYINTNKGLHYINNVIGDDARIVKHSSPNVNPGNYDGEQFESYVDLVFNTRLDLNKQYQALEWVTECFDIESGNYLQFETLDKIMIYTHHQCSGYVEINKNDMKVARKIDGKWQFNEFRDMLRTPETIFLDDKGALIPDTIINKKWFNKNMFINNFLVVRVVFDNQTNVIKHLQNINVKSIINQR